MKDNIAKAKDDDFGDGEVDVLDGTPDDSWIEGATADKTFTIKTAEELAGFRQAIQDGTKFNNWKIYLDTNIDLNGQELPAIDGAFQGFFDGQGHVIYNYKMTLTSGAGFFGTVGYKSNNLRTISNFALVKADCTISAEGMTNDGKDAFSPIAPITMYTVDITNVYTDATIKLAEGVDAKVYNVGGFIGRIATGGNKYYTDCEFAGSIDLSDSDIEGMGENTAGFIGYINSGTPTFERCSISGEKIATDGDYTAGFIGFNASTGGISYTDCKNVANISGKDYVGGFTACTVKEDAVNGRQIFTNCLNSGAVTGENYVGGFVGQINLYGAGMATIHSSSKLPANVVELTGCTNSGAITATGNAGGLIGRVQAIRVTITDCEVSGTVTATNNVAGSLVGVLFDKDATMPTGVAPSATQTGCTLDANMPLVGLRNRLVGYQVTEAVEGFYDLRFVAAVNVNGLGSETGLGFKVRLFYKDAEGNKQEKVLENAEAYVKTVYISIRGGDETYAASTYLGEYLCTLVIEGVPEDYTIAGGTLEVLITPFTAVEVDSEAVKTEYKTEQYGAIA